MVRTTTLDLKFRTKFGDMVKNRRTYKTPGTPSLSLVRETDESQCVSAEKQTLYRSGVGMLLYLVKHSRPDIANCVRELSKVLDGTTDCAFNEMLRIIKYVLDTKIWVSKLSLMISLLDHHSRLLASHIATMQMILKQGEALVDI